MSTLNDVKQFMNDNGVTMRLFGATKAFQEEYCRRLNVIGEAFMKDRNITAEGAAALDLSSDLGDGSQKHFDELRAWVKTQMRT